MNYECVVSEYQIVSNQKFFEIEIENDSNILNIGCFPVCEMVQPDVNAYWRLDFTECSDDTGWLLYANAQVETIVAGTCMQTATMRSDYCTNATGRNCFCPKSSSNISFLTQRNEIGISTQKYRYDVVSHFYLYNICNKC